MNRAVITGIGTWLPDQIRSNDAWPSSFAEGAHLHGDRTFNDIPAAEDPVAAAILARDLAAEASDPFLGAKLRHVADESIGAAEAEAHAAAAALANAGIQARQVNLIISNSLVPDRVSPPSAPDVANRIGAHAALALGVDAACSSSLAQLELARAYVESGLADVVLLTQSHLLLRMMPLTHPASPGLGDGASAYVVERGKPGLRIRSSFGVSHGEFFRAVVFTSGSGRGSERPWYRAGEGDFRLGTLEPALVKRLMRDTIDFGAATIREAARRAEVDVKDIGVLASVQPRGFMPGGIAERLGLPRECAVTTYPRIAHLGACGPVFNLAEARDRGLFVPETIIALYAQGAGFTRMAAILQA